MCCLFQTGTTWQYLVRYHQACWLKWARNALVNTAVTDNFCSRIRPSFFCTYNTWKATLLFVLVFEWIMVYIKLKIAQWRVFVSSAISNICYKGTIYNRQWNAFKKECGLPMIYLTKTSELSTTGLSTFHFLRLWRMIYGMYFRDGIFPLTVIWKAHWRRPDKPEKAIILRPKICCHPPYN